MPRLSPNNCNEERITFGSYERKMLQDYLRFQKNKNLSNNLTKIATTTIDATGRVLASIPLIVGAWIAKETLTSDDVKNNLSGWWESIKDGSAFKFRNEEGKIQQWGLGWLDKWI